MHARISALVLAFVLAFTGLAAAQETTGTITGRLVDGQGLAIPGASVTITGPQGGRTVVTDNTGRFEAPFLTPGSYSIRAELQGFKVIEQKEIAVGLGQTVDLPLKMEVGGLTETVQVTGAAPLLDRHSTTAGAVISSEMLQNVPVGRRLADALYLAPGVSGSDTAGRMNPSMSGGTGLDNLYVIDGVNVSSTGYGELGSFSTIYRSLGNATPFDFIQEIQVKTAEVRSGIRPVDGRRGQRRHEERLQQPSRLALRLFAAA